MEDKSSSNASPSPLDATRHSSNETSAPSGPVRVRLSRAKGWKMPPNTAVVSRPSKWGNPHDWRSWRENWPRHLPIQKLHSDQTSRDEWCKDRAAQAFREDLTDGSLTLPVHELRGKNLACWCALCAQHRAGKPFGLHCDACAPCHADVLLELANAPTDAARSASQRQVEGQGPGPNPANIAKSWAQTIRDAYDAGLTVSTLQLELGASPATQARWAAGERQPREGTRRLMRTALSDLAAATTAMESHNHSEGEG